MPDPLEELAAARRNTRRDGAIPKIDGSFGVRGILFLAFGSFLVIGIAAAVIIWSETVHSSATEALLTASPIRPATAAAATRPVVSIEKTGIDFVVPPAQAVTVTVSGAAWITRNNGSSDILRGLRVALVDHTIKNPRPYCSYLVYAVPKWRELASDYRKMAAENDGFAKQFNDAAEFDKAKEYRSIASDYEKRIEDISAFCKDPREINSDILYSLVLKWSPETPPQFPSTLTVAETKTNVDGKYTIKALIFPGDYFIFAAFESDALRGRWMVPIKIGSENIEVDLSNDNCLPIQRN